MKTVTRIALLMLAVVAVSLPSAPTVLYAQSAVQAYRVLNRTRVPCDGVVRSTGYAFVNSVNIEVYSVSFVAEPVSGASGTWLSRIMLNGDPVGSWWAEVYNNGDKPTHDVSWNTAVYIIPPSRSLQFEYACTGGGVKNFRTIVHAE